MRPVLYKERRIRLLEEDGELGLPALDCANNVDNRTEKEGIEKLESEDKVECDQPLQSF